MENYHLLNYKDHENNAAIPTKIRHDQIQTFIKLIVEVSSGIYA